MPSDPIIEDATTFADPLLRLHDLGEQALNLAEARWGWGCNEPLSDRDY
jgi:hypothetical protein